MVSATTVYQQLTDSSGEVEGTQTAGPDFDLITKIGSFISPISVINGSIGGGLIVYRVDGGGASSFAIYIATSSSLTRSTGADIAVTGSPGTTFPDDGNDYFVDMTYTYFDNFTEGLTYYVYVGAEPQGFVRTNLSEDFVYGYVTDSNGESVTIVPGLPGFTDIGISTTSQQVYCNQNFSTSSGLLDNLGQSISLGVCNVGVFLFVPSTASLEKFTQLASTSRNRAPISYFYDVYSSVNELTATTTTNLPTYTADLAGTGIGSTTSIGNVLPSLTILSQATVNTYLPSGIYTALMFLARAALWVITGLTLYRIAKNEFKPKHT